MKGLQLIFPLLCIMMVGYLCRRKGLLDPVTSTKINLLLYWIINPALLFRSTYLMGAEADPSLVFIGAVYAPFLLIPPLAWGIARFFKNPPERLGVAVLVSTRSNNIFMGIPVISMALGEAGMEVYGLFLAFGMVGYMVITIAWAELSFSGKLCPSALRASFFKVLKNPLVFSCLGGVILGALFSSRLPQGFSTSMHILGKSASALALLTLGSALHPGKLVSGLRESWKDVGMKLFVHPLVVWLLCLFLFPSLDPIEMKVLVILAALPAAVNNLPLAQGMGLDREYTAEIIATTTLLSVFTIPLWLTVVGI